MTDSRRRSFVPPTSAGLPPIRPAPELLRSWSQRTEKLCQVKPSLISRHLSTEVADRHPGDWQNVYLQKLKELYQQQIGCDVAFQVGGDEAIVKAHRILLEIHRVTIVEPNNNSDDSQQQQQWIKVQDDFFKHHPNELRAVVAACYGFLLDPRMSDAIVQGGRDDCLQGIPQSPRLLLKGIAQYLCGSPSDWHESPQATTRERVKIMASPGASPDTELEWSIRGHAALLCAQSDLFCQVLMSDSPEEAPPTDADQEQGYSLPFYIVRVDSSKFTKDLMQELVASCYAASTTMTANSELSVESILYLIEGAAHFGIKAASLQCEGALAKRIDPSNLADMFQFARAHDAQRLRLDCHKYLCRNLLSIAKAGDDIVSKQDREQLHDMLQSDHVDASEQEILDMMWRWWHLNTTSISEEDAKELFALVRLAFVPSDSEIVQQLVEKNLVDEETLRLCRQFQTDEVFREKKIHTEPMYTPRQIEADEWKSSSTHSQNSSWAPPNFDMTAMNANLPS
ncbi:expressed unknown protein [Seminavis robusta]|uniref:BACK domain-containing protein n=1 Tax=Seminavis robusta TaxID=568900 RepID=A0A9N8EEY1_9STRA|nr:expressed unknown protein [Seminavis robusta]|eukprot:Sro844_g209910.1 n/a (511) ;mRNA; f:33895-35427